MRIAANTYGMTADRLRELVHYEPRTGVFTRLVTTSPKAQDGGIAGKSPSSTLVYARLRVDCHEHQAHRLAWLYVHGVWPEFDIDHINGNRHDNRIENLRDVPHKWNMQNRVILPKRNLPTGVYFDDRYAKPYRVYIKYDQKQKHIGGFASPEEAHEAFLVAKRLYQPGAIVRATDATAGEKTS